MRGEKYADAKSAITGSTHIAIFSQIVYLHLLFIFNSGKPVTLRLYRLAIDTGKAVS